MDYKGWRTLSDDELAKRDIAQVNLTAALDLPGAEDLDIGSHLAKLDEWARLVAIAIDRSWKWRPQPAYGDLTDNQYRILVMVTVLQRTIGLRYNLGFMEGEYDASDSRNLFIHGILQGHGGTCVTMPVLYAAIGRRLGFPIKLVLAKQHMFCRWTGLDGERFNIEATSLGFEPRSDEYYLTWPKPITPDECQQGHYLRNLTPREELAFFVGQRGSCWRDNFQTFRAVEAHYHAHKLAPHVLSHECEWGLSIILHRAVEKLDYQSRTTPWARHVRMPEPIEEWEKRFYPIAHQHLVRMLANKKRRVIRESHDDAIQQFVGVPTN